MSIAELPEEMLERIFLFSVLACEGVPALRNAPWNVSQVSRLWRSITLGDGRLWAHLCISNADGLCYEDDESEERLLGPDGGLRLLRIWLERSRDASLHYFVDDLTSWSRQALYLLLDHQKRWKRMGFNLAGLNCKQRVQLLSLPVAEMLLVEIDWNRSEDPYVGDTPHEIEAPSNESFGPAFAFTSFEASNAVAPCLTDLRLKFEEVLHVHLRLFTLPLLRQCPSLQRLEIDFVPKPKLFCDVDVEEAPIIALPHLRSLQFFTKYDSCTSFLRRLATPSLERLDVKTIGIYIPGARQRVVEDMLHVVRETTSTLRNLRIMHHSETNFHPELFSLIESTIVELYIPRACRVLEYVAATGNAENSVVFPNLEVLVLVDTPDKREPEEEECIETLKKLMAAMACCPKLRVVATKITPEHMQDEELGRLIREGKLRHFEAEYY